MTYRNYFGNQNSTLGSVVPLAMFLISRDEEKGCNLITKMKHFKYLNPVIKVVEKSLQFHLQSEMSKIFQDIVPKGPLKIDTQIGDADAICHQHLIKIIDAD